ncbi:hypothetical protein [Natronococcus pandeyae]|uniref:hypothetical protein n=1 Tax=Natronococcus pandeyae TaxID=2055836 RepID=UPI0011E79D46|nr:hypothetical protein [Natronococcus pandeyae]
MTEGRYLRVLTSYDLLGNLLPGIFALSVLITLFSEPPIPTGTVGILFSGLLGYSLGHFLQFHAAIATGNCFEATLDSVREYPLRSKSEDANSGLSSFKQNQNVKSNLTWLDRFVITIKNINRETVYGLVRYFLDILKLQLLFSPIYQPMICWKRDPAGRVLDNEQGAFEVLKDIVTRYDIDRGTRDYHRLTNIISSEIDDITSPARSTRFQAIRNFHRAMWLTSWYSLILVTIFVMLDNFSSLQILLELVGLEYSEPGLFGYWGPNWHFIIGFGILTFIFQRIAIKFEIQFTEYLFSDYRVSREQDREENGWKTKETKRKE